MAAPIATPSTTSASKQSTDRLLIQCCKEPSPYDTDIDVAAASRKGYMTEEQETHLPLGQVIAQLGSADTETLDR